MDVQIFLASLHIYAEHAARKGEKEWKRYWTKCVKRLEQYDRATAIMVRAAARLDFYRFHLAATRIQDKTHATLASNFPSSFSSARNDISPLVPPSLFKETKPRERPSIVPKDAIKYGKSLIYYAQEVDTLLNLVSGANAGDVQDHARYAACAVFGVLGLRYCLYGIAGDQRELVEMDTRSTSWCPLCFRRARRALNKERQPRYCDIHALVVDKKNRSAYNQAKRLAKLAPDRMESIHFLQREIDKFVAECLLFKEDHCAKIIEIQNWQDWLQKKLLANNPRVSNIVKGVNLCKEWGDAVSFIYTRLRHEEDSLAFEVLKMTITAAEIWYELEEKLCTPRGSTIEKIAELAKNGYTRSEIAKLLQITPSAVSKAISRNFSLRELFG